MQILLSNTKLDNVLECEFYTLVIFEMCKLLSFYLVHYSSFTILLHML